MAKFFIGSQVIDLSQVTSIRIVKLGAAKWFVLGGLCLCFAALFLLSGIGSPLDGAVRWLILGGISGLGLILIAVAISRPYGVEVAYAAGRGLVVACLSRDHAAQVKTDLERRVTVSA